jgi:hypothetical protein
MGTLCAKPPSKKSAPICFIRVIRVPSLLLETVRPPEMIFVIPHSLLEEGGRRPGGVFHTLF